ncbi:MAG: NRDE family protein [Deltaproteobacteria bacterium]|nr:NRDE family protein [Deltaproteobacteria bacterium]
MCLILLMYRNHPDMEVLLGGNRDEFLHRLADPPAWLEGRVFAGRDRQAGGTWMGRNERGLLAAVTNHHVPRREGEAGSQDGEAPSRGDLVLGLLRSGGVGQALEWLAGRDISRYRGFNLLFGDAGGFYFLASHDSRGIRPLPPGSYVLSNTTLDDTGWPKAARARQWLQQARGLPGENLLEGLQAFLCEPERPGAEAAPWDAVFLEPRQLPAPDGPLAYGTVSSTIITSGGPLGGRYYFARADDMLTAGPWARSLLGDPSRSPSSGPQRSPFRLLEG